MISVNVEMVLNIPAMDMCMVMILNGNSQISTVLVTVNVMVKVKGKAFPLHAWTGPWGCWRLRLQNF
jgi:hypothetical protein